MTLRSLYRLMSPLSFSIGGPVTATLKASGTVAMLGKEVEGRSLAVEPLVRTEGARCWRFRPASPLRAVRGSFCEIDRGMEPDQMVTRIERFCDREALADHINGPFR